MHSIVGAVLLSTLMAGDLEKVEGARHVTVFGEKGKFGGWPANHGIWNWGDEILVGFSAGIHKDLGGERHNIDREKPERHLLARSMDGGETWTIEDPSEKGALIPVGKSLHGVTPPGLVEKPWADCPGGIDFTHPDLALTFRMTDSNIGPSRFYYSNNRGHDWLGPFSVPDFGTPGVAARTDYVVNSKDDCLVFLTAGKANKKEGRVICVRTSDGGKTWTHQGDIGPEPAGFAIMPATVRVGDTPGKGDLVSAIRRKESTGHSIEVYRSKDDGKTWSLDNVPVPDCGEGNPASLIRLRDGRLCLTYGHRKAPFSMRARLSPDGGKSWGPILVLRDDGGGRDLGYPRSVQRPDGKVATIYYFWDKATGPERKIVATIWDPGSK